MRTSITVTALAVALIPAAASAQGTAPAPASTPPAVTTAVGSSIAVKGPTVWGILPWGGFGVGGRFMIPLNIGPLLVNTAFRDGFALEFGADLLHWSYSIFGHGYSWTEVLPVGGIMWNVWFNDQLALYPKVELGFGLGWYGGDWDNTYGSRGSYGGFFWDTAFGAMYRLPAGVTLRAEAGVHGLKLGAGWLF